MKRIFTFLLLIAVFTSTAQRSKAFLWAPDGNAYYSAEGNEILKYALPKFEKTVLLDAKALTPANATKPLNVKNVSVQANEQLFLIYTNTQKVWRYETRGDYWVYNKAKNTLTQLGKKLPEASLMFAKLSPDGKKAAYVSKHNIYVEDLASGTIKQLTKDGTDRVINGTFDWVYEEEFGCRDGFRWNPDSKSIAYWQIDARKIRNFLMINTTDSIYSYTIPVEYPKVGEDPSACKIGVVDVLTGFSKWMKVPDSEIQNYIPRMEWTVDGKDLIIQQLDRKQQVSKLMLVNALSATAKTIYEEKDNAWIDIKSRWNDDDPTGWEWFKNGNNFLWISEKDGWRHIYALSKDGKNETLLTKGNYDMIKLSAIDEKNGFVYFMASPDNPLQQYLYRVKLDGSSNSPEIVTNLTQKGTHSYKLSPNAEYAEHSFSSLSITPRKEWVKINDGEIIKPFNNTSAKINNAATFFSITTEDGVTMDGWRILPKNFDSTKKYPIVFYVYTEPGSATVSDRYGSAGTFLYAGDIAADGYIQVSIDGRGTPSPKGAAWRKSIYRKVGILNIHDQAMAAKKIINDWTFVDKDRVAVWGWSGGGSTTLNLMFQHADIYKTGIAIAPVAYRLSYDNIYEERYMGLPQENKQDYIQASAITHAKGLKGNLLVVHGTGDDNVHYQNTEMLINELVKNGKQFSLMSYPNRTHSISEGAGTSMHLATLFTNYLKQNCPPGAK